jgi:hypothetical protein
MECDHGPAVRANKPENLGTAGDAPRLIIEWTASGWSARYLAAASSQQMRRQRAWDV